METNIPPGVPVTWTHSPNLQHLGGGTFHTTAPLGTGQRNSVRATVNGVSTPFHELWVGTPYIRRIVSGGVVCNSVIRFEAEIPYPWAQRHTINYFTWDLKNPWDARFVGDTSGEVYVDISSHTTTILTVTATNDCGSAQQWAIISGPGWRASPTTHTLSRPIYGAFQVLLLSEADDRRQNVFDVRIYDSRGNMVRQVVTEDGSVEFDLSGLPDGNYYLRICNGVDEPMIQPVVVENRN